MVQTTNPKGAAKVEVASIIPGLQVRVLPVLFSVSSSIAYADRKTKTVGDVGKERRLHRSIVLASLLMAYLAMAGCSDESSQPEAVQKLSPEQTASAAHAGSELPCPAQSWDIFLLQGKRMGYGHTTVAFIDENGKKFVLTKNVCRLTIRRGADTSEQVLASSSVETPRGELIRFESDVQMGPSALHSAGRVNGDRLEIEMTSAGKAATTRFSLPWSSDYRGPFAAEQNLLRRPMKPGERREFKTIVIGFNQIGSMELVAKGFEPVELPDGDRELLRIDTLTRLPDGQLIDGTVWCDRSGETLKTSSKAMGLETFRVSKAMALASADAAELDLLPSMSVKVDRQIVEPHRTTRGAIPGPSCGRQSVSRVCRRAVTGGQTDRLRHGRGYGLRDPAGRRRRQPARAARQSHRCGPCAEQLHTERRSFDPLKSQGGRRRRG